MSLSNAWLAGSGGGCFNMATASKRRDGSGIFWMNGASDEEQSLAFVPGVDRGMKTPMPFSLRPDGTGTSSKRGSKLRVKHGFGCKNQGPQNTAERKQGHLESNFSGTFTKENVPVQHVAVPSMHTISQSHDALSQVNSENSREKTEVSLKDLCLEDKKRIANLIEELARVSEEKEESVQRLKDEQGNFERKVQQMEQQNLMIAQERESLQQQYRECQELLRLYQQYLTHQQAKLNQSIAELSQPPNHSKVLSSEEAPSRTSASRANGSLLDGSYLSLAATKTQQAQACRSGNARRGALETFRNPTSVSCDCKLSPNHEPFQQHVCRKRECRQPHTCCPSECCQGSCHDTGCRTQQWRSDSSSCLVNCHHDTSSQKECERPHRRNIKGSEAKEDLTRPLLGHKDWEEKRHQLLLQKIQLETERERLQARLAEQEERLNRQSEQLRQSQLDYSRIQQPCQAQLSSSNTRNAGPEREDPSHQDLPSSLSEEAEAQNFNKINTPSVPAPSTSGSTHPSGQSKRDIPMSPEKSYSGLSVPPSVSANPKTPETKLDLSLVEILDIFSPISAPEQCKPGARRTRTSQPKLTRIAPKSSEATLLAPSGNYPPSFRQDLEESQILEDIFFIY